MTTEHALRLFGAIDARNADAFVSFLTDDGVFQFGNGPAVRGKAAVHALVAGFFASIDGCAHRLVRLWNDDEHVAMQGEVTYTRKDGRLVVVPFVNVLRMRGDAIGEYLIHIDNTPLFAA